MKYIIILSILFCSCKTYKPNDMKYMSWRIDSIKNNVFYGSSNEYFIQALICDSFKVGEKYRIIENSKGEIKIRKSE